MGIMKRLFRANKKKMNNIRELGRIKYLEKEEVLRFFQAIPVEKHRDRALFDLIYRHGLRRIEVTWLRKEWINNSRIWIKRAKNGISQEYYLHPSSQLLISLYLNERGEDRNPSLFITRESRENKSISKNLVYQLFRRYAEQAKVPADKRFVHILKHSIAVHLLNAGWDIIDVQDWLGHRDIKNTAIYGKISNRRREKQFQKILKSNEIANTIVGMKVS
jgi:site-specific recombinase XerD